MNLNQKCKPHLKSERLTYSNAVPPARADISIFKVNFPSVEAVYRRLKCKALSETFVISFRQKINKRFKNLLDFLLNYNY